MAKDYVVPTPGGPDDTGAAGLARRLARYIVDNLDAPVSIGVRRGADVDLFGNSKPKEQQGYHAHLLLPASRILLEGDGGGDS